MILISPELLVFLVVILLNVYAPNQLIMLGSLFKSNEEIWKFLPTLPLLFSGIALKASNKVRAPFDSASNKALYEWPLYAMVTDRVTLSKIYCLVCGAGAISIWILCKQIPENIIASIFLISTLISGATALFLHDASQRIREIMELHT